MWFEDVGMLPHFTRNILIFSYNLSYIAIFVYFVVSAYQDNRKTYFISLEDDAGECQEIGRPTTGEFLISTGVNFSNYAYETSPDFVYNGSAYSLTLDSYQSTFEQFQLHLDAASFALQSLDEIGKERDLAWNSLAWTTFEYLSKVEGEGVFSLRTLGDPALLYGQGLFMAAITGTSGYCDEKVEVAYDLTTAKYTLSLEGYNRNATCKDLITASLLQKETFSGPPPPDLSFQIDMYAYTMAASMNMGIMDLSNMVQMKDSSFPVDSDDDFGGEDDDDNYDDDGDDFCKLKLGVVCMFPILSFTCLPFIYQ